MDYGCRFARGAFYLVVLIILPSVVSKAWMVVKNKIKTIFVLPHHLKDLLLGV